MSSDSTETDAAPAADLDDIEFEEDSILSPQAIGLLIVMLVIGVVFGLVGMSSYQNRRLYQQRTDNAERVARDLKKRVDAFETVQTIVGNLNPNEVQYDEAEKLANQKITLSSDAIGTQRLMLGGERTMLLTSYIVEAERLTKLLKRHNRYTNEVDKEELQKLMGDDQEGEGQGGEGAAEEQTTYGIIFNLDHLLRGLQQEDANKDFKPKFGKLVEVMNFDNPEDGKVRYRFLNSERERTADVRSIVPLKESELKTSSGPNALERYQQRIKRITLLVKKLRGRPDSILDKVQELSQRPPPPMIQL